MSSSRTSDSASAYTQGHSPSVVASHISRTIYNSAQFLLPYIQPTFTIVDLGCGPGTITKGFSSVVPQGKVIGIDASDTVIKQARTTAPIREYPNLKFEVGNITTRLPFEDDSVDVVFTHQTLCHIPSPIAVIQEALRILKPGGLIAMREFDTLLWHPLSPGVKAYNESMGKAVSATGAQGPGSGRKLHVWASKAGFDRAKMRIGTGTTCHVDAEAKWWANVCIGRLEGEIGPQWVRDGIVRSQENVEEMLKDLRKWIDDEEAWYTSLHGEVIAWK